MNTCPICNREGIYWDGRAKILFCPWINCFHVVRNILEWKNKVPTEKEIKSILMDDVDDNIYDRFEIMDL